MPAVTKRFTFRLTPDECIDLVSVMDGDRNNLIDVRANGGKTLYYVVTDEFREKLVELVTKLILPAEGERVVVSNNFFVKLNDNAKIANKTFNAYMVRK